MVLEECLGTRGQKHSRSNQRSVFFVGLECIVTSEFMCGSLVRASEWCQRVVWGRCPWGYIKYLNGFYTICNIYIVSPMAPIYTPGKLCIVRIVDVSTRSPDAVGLRSVDTQTVAVASLDLFWRYGMPYEKLSDRGSNFRQSSWDK